MECSFSVYGLVGIMVCTQVCLVKYSALWIQRGVYKFTLLLLEILFVVSSIPQWMVQSEKMCSEVSSADIMLQLVQYVFGNIAVCDSIP